MTSRSQRLRGAFSVSPTCHEPGTSSSFFYPADWGWVCNDEMKEFRERETEFTKAGARLVAIGTNSAISHRGWKEMLHLDFPVLSDFYGAVTRPYDVLDTTDGFNKERSVRAVFLLDAKGIVRYRWIAANPWVEPDYDHVLRETRLLAQQ
ncbi:MAG TPA: redoxin domain-containing protein [Methanomassiliicoccales archaeon]|nr:redoxin domain-containing protein [Methanomassiliicoccales archaeon]